VGSYIPVEFIDVSEENTPFINFSNLLAYVYIGADRFAVLMVVILETPILRHRVL